MTEHTSTKPKLYLGIGMAVTFIIVLGIIFSPVFKGQNGLEYLDSLYNSISKGSAYYIPSVRQKMEAYSEHTINISIEMATEVQSAQTALLFEKGGAQVLAAGTKLDINGNIRNIIENCLEDANFMYNNNGQAMQNKYGYDERQALYNWYRAFKGVEKALNKQKKFKDAEIISLTMKKAIECSYNYYTIEPKKITDSLGVVIFSLVFYVVYTLWYGFAVMYLFEGWGLKLEH